MSLGIYNQTVLPDCDPLKKIDASVSCSARQRRGSEKELTVHRHLSFKLEITLVADNHGGEPVEIFHAEDVLVQRSDFLKGFAAVNGIDQHEALSGAHILLSHCSVRCRR
jgi:hypothetical protein